jgi:NADH-quinone oxidoreductase subunit A
LNIKNTLKEGSFYCNHNDFVMNDSNTILNEKLFFNILENKFSLSFFYTEYFFILIALLVAIVLGSVILLLSYLLIFQNPDTEKLSTYECGFEPYEDARHKFDVKFYLIAILFIVFDIEAMYLFPWSISISNINSIGFCAMVDFIIELGVGFAYVWFVHALEWD